MSAIANHPQRNTIRLQLKQNLILREMPVAAWEDLEPQLEIDEYKKGETLVRQGSTAMEQFFILEGILKRVVSNPQGKEMILRFAAETDMDTSYAAWRLKTPVPYSIASEIKLRFEYEVMRLMSEVMAHTITLHLLGAPGRLARFMRKHQDLLGRIPKKELASYLNLTPETLSRLRQHVSEPTDT